MRSMKRTWRDVQKNSPSAREGLCDRFSKLIVPVLPIIFSACGWQETVVNLQHKRGEAGAHMQVAAVFGWVIPRAVWLLVFE